MARVKFNRSKEPFRVLSLGAGKQSTYMLLEALAGKFEFKPDAAVFANLGNEPESVISALSRLKEYVWTRYKFKIVELFPGNITDLVLDHVQGKSKWSPTPPFWYSQNESMRRQCTLHLKIRPIRKWIRENMNERPVQLWIGISMDEMERMKKSDVKYITNYYPLVVKRINLAAIKNYFSKHELSEPPKSSCKICPYHSKPYLRRFKANSPSEFHEVCVFDQLIRQFPNNRSRTYITKDCVPLKDLNLDFEDSLFPELIEDCSGLCGI